MAMLAITWRNPKCAHHLRRWTHVRRDANRSLYLVLESGARGQRLQTGA